MRRLIPTLFVLVIAGLACDVAAQPPEIRAAIEKAKREGKPFKMPSRGEDGKKKDKSGDEDEKDSGDEEPKEGEESPEPKIIRRDGLELPKGDPAELKATVGDDGKVGFQFRNQGWVDLIGWLSDISDQPIDWQELPGDSVNLVSPKRLTIPETVDLINRHLLSRGFTMLELEGGISVVKTEAINPGMVRRVAVDDLRSLPDHAFVRTMLDAGWLSAEKLSGELKAMLSGAGKLTALATTNRLEAMDAAVNLRQIAHLLSEERDAASRDALAPEFRLLHIPAEEAKRLLEAFLGVKEEKAMPMSREQMQMMQRMQQQNQGKGAPKEPEVKVSIVANVRQNSVLVRAPIDQVAVAAEFIKRIDVPGSSLSSLTDATSRVEVFRLESLDPEKLIEIAQEMNVLEPTTRIRVDKDNSAVIVSGAAVDRFIIKSLIERLDGGKRKLEVMQLRRLDAAEVAESIAFLMGQKDDKEDKGSSRRYYYYGYGDDDDDKDEDQFRVAANTRFRQVLLWANEREMEEVRSLLIKLGELPPPGGSGRGVRVIEAAATPETLEYLQRLKQQWQSMSGVELILPADSEFKDPIDRASDDSDDSMDADDSSDADDESELEPNEAGDLNTEETELTNSPINPSNNHVSTNPFASESLVVFQSAEVPAKSKSVVEQPAVDKPIGNVKASAPIKIGLDAAGNLVLSSSDTKALDALENLMLDIKPPTRPYQIFKVKNASVSLLVMDLEDYFEEAGDEKDSDADSFYRWYWGGDDDEKDLGPTGLARTGKLRFLPNSDTGTIVVSGATSEQLRTIGELIRLWDVAEPINARKSRFTKLITIDYGRAEKIAETVKDAYRDLLSSNDKAFSGGGKGKKQGKGDSNRSGGSGLEDSDSDRSGGGEDFSFNGKLSMGVDEIGNTLLVSAEGESLLELISSMIQKLDVAAKPGGGIEIVKVSGSVSPELLRQALSSLGADSESSSRDRSERSSSKNSRSQLSRD